MDRRISLLLVEDEDVLRMLVGEFLRSEGFVISEASDGGEGVRKYLEEGPFDLLLVDLNLPVFSGVEVCRKIKQSNPLQKIMICSAAIDPKHEVQLVGLGVDHFLTKPYHPANLVVQIRLELARAANPTPSTILTTETRPA
ncbi:response regulator transcription factor [Tundrisphaera lichenicola]|uniref:response regulator transcription factor n=1 Tax=Tundrisphaera lichenicola TaxID=2029860 RepID=UPI003EC0C55A